MAVNRSDLLNANAVIPDEMAAAARAFLIRKDAADLVDMLGIEADA